MMMPLFGFSDISVADGEISAATALKYLQGVGADVYRMGVDWQWIEYSKGVYQWGNYGNIYDTFSAAGIKLICILETCPQFYADPAFTPSGGYTGWQPPSLANMPAWEAFCTAAAKRFPKAVAFEVWNEPNNGWAWGSHQDVGRYTLMLQKAYESIKAVNPAPIITGGLAGTTTTTSTDTSVKDFMWGIYYCEGGDYFDGIGIHPYPYSTDPTVFDSTLAAARYWRDKAAQSHKPLWLTEMGFTTGPAGPASEHFTDEGQAQALGSFYQRAMAEPDAAAVCFWSLVDGKNATRVHNDGFGVVRYQNPLPYKPAYCTLAQLRGKPSPAGGCVAEILT
jgi:hypothetical protein